YEKDVQLLKNAIGNRNPCELNDYEFAEVEKIVKEKCGDEAVENLRKNENKARLFSV
uniref:Uncharacterized protein n=1 Tax=Caenorhabditis japonica TaxID=281687 RepID=A0A8R1INN4_CAEJA